MSIHFYLSLVYNNFLSENLYKVIKFIHVSSQLSVLSKGKIIILLYH